MTRINVISSVSIAPGQHPLFVQASEAGLGPQVEDNGLMAVDPEGWVTYDIEPLVFFNREIPLHVKESTGRNVYDLLCRAHEHKLANRAAHPGNLAFDSDDRPVLPWWGNACRNIGPRNYDLYGPSEAAPSPDGFDRAIYWDVAPQRSLGDIYGKLG